MVLGWNSERNSSDYWGRHGDSWKTQKLGQRDAGPVSSLARWSNRTARTNLRRKEVRFRKRPRSQRVGRTENKRNCWLNNVITTSSSCKEKKRTKKLFWHGWDHAKCHCAQPWANADSLVLLFTRHHKWNEKSFFWRTSSQRQDWFTILSLAFLIRYDGWEHGHFPNLAEFSEGAGMAQNGCNRKGLRHVAPLSLIFFLVKVLNKPSNTPIATTRRHNLLLLGWSPSKW